MSKPGIVSATNQIAASTGIAQDNVIFAMIAFAFIVWITSKGELPTYLAFFKPGSNGVGNPLGIDTTVTPSSTTGGGATGAAVPSAIPGVPALTSNPLQGLPYVPTWLGGTGQGITSGLPDHIGGVVGALINGGNATPAQTPGQANPVPGFSAIGSWLKGLTGIGQ
jgi:hypothetical protein